ncbi:MAG: ABC transporter permease [Thermoanaerobaculia bacterium]|nr:ABC transporter permease [Thermoanaerobaculia bacterium]
MGSLLSDVKIAVRRLASSPLFVIVAALTLALGIGLNATIFTFVDAVLLRPLPVKDPGELVAVFTSWPEEVHATSSRPDWLDLQRAGDESSDLFGHSIMIATLQVSGRGELIVGELATGNYFDVLGVQPIHGRMLTPDDDRPGSSRVVVVSWSFFQRRLGSDPSSLGQMIRLNGEAYEVVGVAPKDFAGMFPGGKVELWAPSIRFTELDPVSQIHNDRREAHLPPEERRGYRWMWLKARLPGDVSAEHLESQLGLVMASLAESHPVSHSNVGVRVLPESRVRFHPDIDGALRAGAVALTGLVALVLLVACANLANMLLARAVGRRREVAVRLALGGGRMQVMRLLLVEVVLVSLLGGALALAVAAIASKALLTHLPPVGVQFDLAVGIDRRIMGFTALLSLVSALVATALPALQTTNPNLVPALKEGVGGNLGSSSKLRSGLVLAQVAVSMVLLVASGLVLRGLAEAHATDLGYEPGRIATFGLNLSMHGYELEAADDFLRRLTERVEALPQVEQASLAKRIPLIVNYHAQRLLPDSRQWTREDTGIAIDVTWADDAYFDTLGVPIVRGRALEDSDSRGGHLVAVVSQAAAAKLWPGSDALGRRFRVGDSEGAEFEVVGVSSDYAVRAVGEDPRPMAHFAWNQRPADNGYVMARSRARDADALVSDMRRVALEMDPSLAVTGAQTLEDIAGLTLYPVRIASVLLTIFAALGLFLSAVGLYGVVAYTARRRQREMGVRVALGASPADVLRLLAGRGMVLVAVGCAFGSIVAVFAGRGLSGILYGRSPADPLAFLGAAVVILTVALFANLAPALRASRRDPVVALREE